MITTYFKNMIANHVWHTSKESALPKTYYLALSKTEPLENGTGVSEPQAENGYARVAVESLSEAADGVVNNEGVMSWPKILTSSGEVSYWALFDAKSGGNLLMGGSLSSSMHLDAGTTVSLLNGDLVLRVLGA